MKYTALLFLFSFIISYTNAQESPDTAKVDSVIEVDFSKLEMENDKYYVKGGDAPFTGNFIMFHDNGVRLAKGQCKNGKFDGEIKGWWENGKLMRRVYYKEGLKIGKWIYWNEYGNKIKEETYKNGDLKDEKSF